MSLPNPVSSGSTRTRTVAVGPATPRREPQRASHQTPSPHVGADAPLPDVLSHPAVIAYSANHPNHPIPKFGAYYMLQTLGEGEFGKVKLGLHSKYGEEVAVKLIRRDTVINEAKMAKIAREIEILDLLKHPNIVRLYDVFETSKYFGIILEFASGGELFDHILAHRFLKERDAAKLFAQLISGVWYMHQKNIVHRDLKLENLLLDRHRNLVITDFGFANHFSHNTNDLMETMCGSPCYAAPELVNSEGLYVGTAADIWSCGVILYAMLSGYLPFDDDPTNPDGEDINRLYAYIARTPLTFPDHLSDQARSLLGAMLVPDPRARADLATIMRHPWFAMNVREVTTFGLTVKELEQLAEDGPTLRRLAYQRTARNGDNGPLTLRSGPPSRSKRTDGTRDTSEERAGSSPLKNTVGSPKKQRGTGRVPESNGKGKEREHGRAEGRSRHTIQVEYGSQRGGREGQRHNSGQGPSEAHKATTTAKSPLAMVFDGSESVRSGSRRDVETSSPQHSRCSADLTRAVMKSMASMVRCGGVPPFDTFSIHDEQPILSINTPRGTLTRTEAKAQLPPLVIDGSSSSSSAKQPLTPTSHPNLNDLAAQAGTSPSKTNKVMQWFRKGRRSFTLSGGLTPSPFSSSKHDAAASSVEVASVPHQATPPPPSQTPFMVTPGTTEHRQRTGSAVSITSLFRRSAGVTSGNKAAMRVHHGAVDHEMITAGRPSEVMQHMREVLNRMGVDVQLEGDFKYRCVRPARRRGRRDVSENVGPRSPSQTRLGAAGDAFRGLLSRRQPSPARRQPSPARAPLAENQPSDGSSAVPTEQPPLPDAVYGDATEDVGDEVRFSVELTRLDRLKDMYSLDVRRLKGNLKSYKFLYDTLRMRADLQR
ncbi:Non-specific serine/threonine protein kinase [Mycena sanguinolenta]|uniref:non-specific serine/threonine protein kinase n=1 Tax=Mycena sanguinolenta TaxID=230812 RepID=A0A8H6Y439_9AGAR|nr:Non-specific serine/threonine protein kinase [Mycena sanguinolenta]